MRLHLLNFAVVIEPRNPISYRADFGWGRWMVFYDHPKFYIRIGRMV